MVDAIMSEMPASARQQLPLYVQAAFDSAVARSLSGHREKVERIPGRCSQGMVTRRS